MLQEVVNDGMLPVAAVLGAESAASAAFDTHGECLRFKVPSSGFLLIWSTCPHSPAHSLLSRSSSPRSGTCAPLATSGGGGPRPRGGARAAQCRRASAVGLKRGPSEELRGSPLQPPPPRSASDSIFIEFGRAPQRALNASGDSGSNGSGSNGSDSTNVGGGSGPNSDSGGSGGGGSGRLPLQCPPKSDCVFAVPPPRPARRPPSELPAELPAAAVPYSQGAPATHAALQATVNLTAAPASSNPVPTPPAPPGASVPVVPANLQ